MHKCDKDSVNKIQARMIMCPYTLEDWVMLQFNRPDTHYIHKSGAKQETSQAEKSTGPIPKLVSK